MRQLKSLLVVPAVALAASGDANAATSQASLGRVQVTLQSLLRNIQDTGRHAEKALKQRHQWCETTAATYSEHEEAMRTDVEHLRLDLLEQEAALEEAEGSLRERHAEVAMLEHTINMTANVLQDAKLNASLATDGQQSRDRSEAEKRLVVLLQSRQQTVVSLQAELSALNPKVSQLQAQVAEGRRQISDRTASSNAQASFGAAVRDSCAASLRNADKQASLRVAEAGAISKALQALEQLGVAPVTQAEKSNADDAALAQGLAEVSFVQLKREKGKAKTSAASDSSSSTESGEEALYSLFGDDEPESDAASEPAGAAAAAPLSSDSEDDAAEPASPESAWDPAVNTIAAVGDLGSSDSASKESEGSNDDDEEADEAEDEDEPAPAGSARRQEAAAPTAQRGSVKSVEQLLSTVRTENQAEDSRRTWCSQERARNEQSLQLAQDAAVRAEGEAQMHADMEAQLGEVLDRLQGAQSQIGNTAQEVADDAARELTSLDAGVKDQDLATKILKQASKFLKESDATGDQAKEGSKQAVKEAVQALAKAKSFFQAEEKLSQQGKEETNSRVSAIADSAREAKAAIEKEANGLVLARDSHSALRRRSEEEKATREAEGAELQKYIQGLAKSCEAVQGGSDNADPEERQQAAEMQMLEDARKVLKGEKIGVQRSGSAGGLRGGAKAPVDTSKLSPLERAALEMGLSTDGS